MKILRIFLAVAFVSFIGFGVTLMQHKHHETSHQNCIAETMQAVCTQSNSVIGSSIFHSKAFTNLLTAFSSDISAKILLAVALLLPVFFLLFRWWQWFYNHGKISWPAQKTFVPELIAPSQESRLRHWNAMKTKIQ